MIPWKPDPRFPLFLSHFLIFYLLLCVPTVCFCLTALVMQVQRWKNDFDSSPCQVYRIATLAIAFPTSIIALGHAVTLIFLSVRQRLTVNTLLYSSLAVTILWIPTLVVGWHPSQNYDYEITLLDDGYYPIRCSTATGLFLAANINYIYYTYELTARLQVLMGVIILTLSTWYAVKRPPPLLPDSVSPRERPGRVLNSCFRSGWAFILFWFGYVHYWRTQSPRSPYYVPASETDSGGGNSNGNETVEAKTEATAARDQGAERDMTEINPLPESRRT